MLKKGKILKPSITRGKWDDFDTLLSWGHDGTITKPAHFCKECEMHCTCHTCMHEISAILKIVKPPRFPNLRKILANTKLEDLIEDDFK